MIADQAIEVGLGVGDLFRAFSARTAHYLSHHHGETLSRWYLVVSLFYSNSRCVHFILFRPYPAEGKKDPWQSAVTATLNVNVVIVHSL